MWLKKGHKGLMFKTEFLVNASRDTEKDPKTGAVTPCNKVGTTCAEIQNLDSTTAQGSQFSNVKALILALLGFDEKEVTNDDFTKTLEELLGPAGEKAQPLRGIRVKCEAFWKEKRTKPGEFIVKKKWTHVGGQTEQSIAARRAELDALAPKAA